MVSLIAILFFYLFPLLLPLVQSATPIVMYHGLGDTFDGSLTSTKTYIEQQIPGIYIISIRMGNNRVEDLKASYFMNLNKQVAKTCKIIANDKNLANGYNAIGFSQGSQILRAVAQRCPHPPMRNLITLGGQHQGVFGLPKCPGDQSIFCNLVRNLLNLGVYLPLVQKSVVQAQYWHDPIQENLYRKRSIFLADINNERTPHNQSYKENLTKLTNFVMVKFLNETQVQPKDSSWFEFYQPGAIQTGRIVPLKKSPIYTEDWIGLKQMDQEGKLKFLAVEGDHIQYNLTWFQSAILKPYLL